MLSSKKLASLINLQPQCLLQVSLKATICHKSELPPKNVYHWPYEKRAWGYFTGLLDPFTAKKFDENSKIILVEGNVNSGKDDFARRLADELGMKYAPPIDLESYYYSDYGYDYRALNPLLPERVRICDWEMWHENPSRHSAIHMQETLYKLRLEQYLRALQHVFNTGQGVVLNRSMYTEKVFVEAMHNLGWLPMGYLRGDGIRFYDWRIRYNFTRERSANYLLRPHLTIYLDRPVDKCMESIKNSSDPMEANSKALIPEFLEGIKEAYENIVLPKLEHNGHVLRYQIDDKMTNDDLMDVIDDIRDLDFEYDVHDTKFATWNTEEHKLWHRRRRYLYTSRAVFHYFTLLRNSWYDIAGMGDSISFVDLTMRDTLFEAHVTPVGFHNDFDSDIKQQGFLKAILDRSTWDRNWKLNVRTEYV